MAQEWKKKEDYVANIVGHVVLLLPFLGSIGDNVPVEDLEDDEYNELSSTVTPLCTIAQGTRSTTAAPTA